MQDNIRHPLMVQPYTRLSDQQIELIHNGSMQILGNPGLTCFNEQAADYYDKAGCPVKRETGNMDAWSVRIPQKVIEKYVKTVPGQIKLGARNPENTLILDAQKPHVYFGTGSETNIVLHSELQEFVNKSDPSNSILRPVFREERGSLKNLCRSAKLCNQLDNLDFFIRNVNIQDKEITLENKDVNVFLGALMYMTKHVQAGLVNIDQLDSVLKMAEIIAGGPDEFRNNPIISFITCVIKSPLQMVADTTDKLIAVAEKGCPVVISSSPQGGSTAPIQEEGIVSLINAEILAGITLAQIVNPGTPVLYGAVPVRARLDNLHDLYGAPEFIHYNVDCIQMARHYGIPCYSSAGVGDAKVPGMQATVEKLFAQLQVAQAGPQYIHYAFGLLDKTNIFSPLQAVLDNAHIGFVKQVLRQPQFDQKNIERMITEIQHTTTSSTKLFARYIRKARREGKVSRPYPFETTEAKDEVMVKAQQQLEEIMSGPEKKPDETCLETVFKIIPGLLGKDKFMIH